MNNTANPMSESRTLCPFSPAVILTGFGAILLAVIAGGTVGDAIPHQRHGSRDPFADTFIFAFVFLAGIGMAVWRKGRMRDRWTSLGIVQFVIVCFAIAYSNFPEFDVSWLAYGSRLVVVPFALGLLIVHLISFLSAGYRRLGPNRAVKF